VSPLLAALGLALLWLVKQVLGMLLSQQINGSISDYTARKAKAAARTLPSDVAAEYEEAWLAELSVLDRKPLSAIRYVRGLPRAARSIAAEITGEAVGSRWWPVLSRALDVNAGIFSLIFLAPALCGIGLAVRLDSRGPSLIRRPRLGKGGEPFGLVGFRTLSLLDRDSDATAVRTSLGRFIERSSLAMLPSLFNLLRGDISLVGPPAQRPGAKFQEPLPVRPGVASWETLVAVGGIDLSLQEARRRDRQRTFRSDISLVAHHLAFVSGGLPGGRF